MLNVSVAKQYTTLEVELEKDRHQNNSLTEQLEHRNRIFDVSQDSVNSQAPAGDKIIFGDDNKISVSEDDDILKAIRDHIIDPRKYEAFKEAFNRNAEDESLEKEILTKSEKSLPVFINDRKNQELVQKAFDDQDF